jgi:hypothetical protein
MKKASEYRQHAQECLALARGMRSTEQKDQLLKMAQMWTNLAEDRERLMRQQAQTSQSNDGGSGEVRASS